MVEYGDGWLPIHGTCNLERRLEDLDRLCAEAGRDRASIDVTLFAAPGGRQELEALTKLGVGRVVLGLPSEPEAQVLARLDGLAHLLG